MGDEDTGQDPEPLPVIDGDKIIEWPKGQHWISDDTLTEEGLWDREVGDVIKVRWKKTIRYYELDSLVSPVLEGEVVPGWWVHRIDIASWSDGEIEVTNEGDDR